MSRPHSLFSPQAGEGDVLPSLRVVRGGLGGIQRLFYDANTRKTVVLKC